MDPERTHSSKGLGIFNSSEIPVDGGTVSAETLRKNSGIMQQATQTSAEPLLSPPISSHLSQSTFVDSPYEGSGFGNYGSPKPSLYSAPSFELHPIRVNSQSRPQPTTLKTSLSSNLEELPETIDHKTILRRRGWSSWVTISTFMLSIFSTIFSGIYLGIAFRAPSYGHYVSVNGNMSASTAAFLTSLFAKIIEMTFVTAMLAVLGQELSKRAYGRSRWQGVSIAEVGMRNWIVQPGTLISRWETVRYAGITVLGVLTLVATLVATLYTPAATALVQPQLRMLEWQQRTMQAAVKTSFANINYMLQSCNTPIPLQYDPVEGAPTCVSIQNAASGYYNFFQYLSQWNSTRKAITSSSVARPAGTALIFGNTTVSAPWIEAIDMAAVHNKTGFVINNVSLAMPHAGIVGASRDQINDILQPADLDGLGAYEVRAGIPSPVIHVLCATLSRDDLKPFVYELWDNVTTPVNMSIWPTQIATADKYLNGTKLDTIFHWDGYYGPMNVPPVFPRLPKEFNTIMNFTGGQSPWGRDSIYMLAKAGPADINNDTDFGIDQDYALCQLRVSQTSKCSTRFSAASSGNTLTAHCEDANDNMAYEHYRDANSRNVSLANPASSGALDWPNVGFPWGTALALNQGVFDGNASIARLLSQQIVRKPALLPDLPSMAEALAVLLANTLLMSSIDAPMVDFWNLTQVPPNILNNSVYQYFPAQVRAQEYASGGSMSYHRAFFPILFIMFLFNVGALVYLALHREWLVDFSESQTLLSLAVSDPATPANVASDETNNHKDWKTNPTGPELAASWAVKECDTGVLIQRAPRHGDDGRSPLQGLRQRMSSQWSNRRSPWDRTPDRSTFREISNG